MNKKKLDICDVIYIISLLLYLSFISVFRSNLNNKYMFLIIFLLATIAFIVSLIKFGNEISDESSPRINITVKSITMVILSLVLILLSIIIQ